MAARRAPPKSREMDFGNVGVAGRRTGVTLEQGKLDEHGMEEIEGMFSSPENSPTVASTNGFANDTILHSEDMETGGSSSIPEPADMLSARRGARNSFVLPPRSRSPIKTNLSGSPRRTLGIRSSPIPHSDQVSSPSSRAVYKRTIAIARTKTQVQSPLNQVRSTPIPAELESPAARGAQERTTGRVDGGPVDFSDEENYLVEEAEHESLYVEPHDDSPGNGSEASESKFIEGDDTNIHESEAEEDHLEEEESPSVAAKAASRGRKRKNAPDEAELSEPQEDVPAPKSRRGPKPKTAQAELNKPDQLKENSRPTKRPKTTTTRERKTELQMSAEQEKELGQVIDKLTKRDGPLKQRSLHILRREDPEDDAVRHTRSGRASVRPLAYWRNEKCVYGAGEAELGQRFPVSTIKEIIRIDEPEPVYTKSGKKVSKRKKSKAKKRRDESSDEEEDDAEPWEADPGVFYGPVKMWDPELQAGTQEEEIMDVAYAPTAIQTQEVKGSTFRFAKILSTPFLGSGFVEMPPGAAKKQKNSKRMHMVFFVYRGRIRVDVSGLEFSAGKGSVFQVPRGNNYSFVNEHDKPAAIFFTQGCIPLDAEGKVDTGAPAPPLPDPVLQQQQIELEQSQIQEEQQQQEGEQELTQPPQKESKGKPGKKKKGRPKQKA